MSPDSRSKPVTRPAGNEVLPPGQRDKSEATAVAALRLTYRLDEVAESLGVSRRTIERERAAGRFPRPDKVIGRVPLWTRETLVAWIAAGGVR